MYSFKKYSCFICVLFLNLLSMMQLKEGKQESESEVRADRNSRTSCKGWILIGPKNEIRTNLVIIKTSIEIYNFSFK